MLWSPCNPLQRFLGYILREKKISFWTLQKHIKFYWFDVSYYIIFWNIQYITMLLFLTAALRTVPAAGKHTIIVKGPTWKILRCFWAMMRPCSLSVNSCLSSHHVRTLLMFLLMSLASYFQARLIVCKVEFSDVTKRTGTWHRKVTTPTAKSLLENPPATMVLQHLRFSSKLIAS